VIRLPALEVLVWMLRISAALTILAALLTATLCALARRHWTSSVPALWPHRLAFGSVVWGALWAVLNLPGLSVVLTLSPLAISALGFAYIASGNRRRGYGNPGLVAPGVWAVGLGVTALIGVGYGMRARRDALAAEEAARSAEGQRAQDYFNGLASIDENAFAIVGTTSSEPSEADDIWVYTVGIDGRLLNATAYPRPGNQAGLTIALAQDGSWMLGGVDAERPFAAQATAEGVARYHRWDTSGALCVLHALGDGRFLAGGEAADSAWIGVIDDSGREHWRKELQPGIPYARVSSVAVAGGRFLAVGSDYLFSRGAFVVGGTLEGRIEWTKAFGGGSDATTALTHVRANPDGTFVALGYRSQADKLEDLWLLHLSPDGTALNEFTLGGALGESSGGLAVRDDDVIVVGHRFTGPDSELWLQAVDLDGNVKWERTYSNSRFGRASDLAVLAGGDLFVVGNRRPEHKSDAWVARFDRSGEPVWQRTYPSDDDESKGPRRGAPDG
jgi:hypothetical protein